MQSFGYCTPKPAAHKPFEHHELGAFEYFDTTGFSGPTGNADGNPCTLFSGFGIVDQHPIILAARLSAGDQEIAKLIDL